MFFLQTVMSLPYPNMPMPPEMKGMLLAAGLGTRMRPLTDQMPKPLLEVAGHSLIDRALDWFSASGVNEVVANSHYKAELLEAHLVVRHVPHIQVMREEVLLETGGGIKNALPLLGSAPFFAANSDTICIDGKVPALHRLLAAWDDKTMDALLLLHPIERAVGYEGMGDFFIGEGGTLRRRGSETMAPFVFTGVQLLHPRMFVGAPSGAFSMNVLYDRGTLPDGTLFRTHALVHDGNWLHVGDPEGLSLAEHWLKTHS
jgi:MurNAc alpha-1-phosphate uridylyltransferase